MMFVCDRCGHESADEHEPCCEDLDECVQQIKQLRRERDGAYRERNQLVAALANLAKERMAGIDGAWWAAGIGRHVPDPDPRWDPAWMSVVFIDTPEGQLSWHVHDDDLPLFIGLPIYQRTWDGHTTERKYERLGRLFR